MTEPLHLVDERGNPVVFAPEVFIIAGYTGRDRVLVQRHIDELAHEGIAPPPEVPMWWEMPPELLTTESEIRVPSAQTSGEVEPLILGNDGTLYLGIGSDHTARDLEREDIAAAKRSCPKPLGHSVFRLQTFGAALDALQLESTIDGQAYQGGSLKQILPLVDLLRVFRQRNRAERFVLSCGTVPLLTQGFRFGAQFVASISGSPLPQPLTLTYRADVASA